MCWPSSRSKSSKLTVISVVVLWRPPTPYTVKSRQNFRASSHRRSVASQSWVILLSLRLGAKLDMRTRRPVPTPKVSVLGAFPSAATTFVQTNVIQYSFKATAVHKRGRWKEVNQTWSELWSIGPDTLRALQQPPALGVTSWSRLSDTASTASPSVFDIFSASAPTCNVFSSTEVYSEQDSIFFFLMSTQFFEDHSGTFCASWQEAKLSVTAYKTIRPDTQTDLHIDIYKYA